MIRERTRAHQADKNPVLLIAWGRAQAWLAPLRFMNWISTYDQMVARRALARRRNTRIWRWRWDSGKHYIFLFDSSTPTGFRGLGRDCLYIPRLTMSRGDAERIAKDLCQSLTKSVKPPRLSSS